MRVLCTVYFPMTADAFCALGKAVGKHFPKAVAQPSNRGSVNFVDLKAHDALRPNAPFEKKPPEWIMAWYCCGEVGQSSLELARWLADETALPSCAPGDGDDARRCAMLLRSCPPGLLGGILDRVRRFCKAFDGWAEWEDGITDLREDVERKRKKPRGS